jgi:hypothetical protein
MGVNDRDSDLELERLVNRVLRELPVRRAPPGMETRVWDELARRAALPWWRRSFAHWPGPARAVFLAVCIGLSALTFVGGARLVLGFGRARGLNEAVASLEAAAGAFASLLRAIPPLWLYEGLALAAVLYAVLFALGAAAYRTLYLEI